MDVDVEVVDVDVVDDDDVVDVDVEVVDDVDVVDVDVEVVDVDVVDDDSDVVDVDDVVDVVELVVDDVDVVEVDVDDNEDELESSLNIPFMNPKNSRSAFRSARTDVRSLVTNSTGSSALSSLLPPRTLIEPFVVTAWNLNV